MENQRESREVKELIIYLAGIDEHGVTGCTGERVVLTGFAGEEWTRVGFWSG